MTVFGRPGGLAVKQPVQWDNAANQENTPVEIIGKNRPAVNLAGDYTKENPGALVGATGADRDTDTDCPKATPEAPIRSRAIQPGEWNQMRWTWQSLVWRDKALPMVCKALVPLIVANAADHRTGVCLWSVPTFAEALAVSEDTIKRAFRALADAGWLARNSGRGRGNRSKLTFYIPENVVAFPAPESRSAGLTQGSVDRPGRVTDGMEKGRSDAPFSGPGKASAAPHKRVQPRPEKGAGLHPRSVPKTFQKDTREATRGDGGPPPPYRGATFVAHQDRSADNDRRAAWDDFLMKREGCRLDQFAEIGGDKDGPGWWVPMSRPPGSNCSDTERMIVNRWLDNRRWHMEARLAAHG